jgi:hypothetical protein
MGVNSSLARVYGSDYDAIYLAPLGTPLPIDANSGLDGAFVEVGWLDDTGIVEANTGSKTELRGHQGNGVVRTRMETGGKTFAFSALEDKPLTREMWDYVKAVTTTPGGNRKELVSPNQRVVPKVAVIDVFDADDDTLKERIIIPRLEVTPDGERAYVNSALSTRGFVGQVIGDYWRIPATVEIAIIEADAWTVTVTGTPTGGTFTLAVNGFSTAPIDYDATLSEVLAAINALSGVTGISGVTGTGTYDLTFPEAVTLAAIAALTGGTDPDVDVTPA